MDGRGDPVSDRIRFLKATLLQYDKYELIGYGNPISSTVLTVLAAERNVYVLTTRPFSTKATLRQFSCKALLRTDLAK